MASRPTNTGGLFKLGGQKVFLPNVKFTLLRSGLSPFFAKFQVPLNCNKFDVRDYLYHVYGLQTLRVNTVVYAQRAQRLTQPKNGKPVGAVIRGTSKKIAFIEMKEPFKFPAPPTDMATWGKDRDLALYDWQRQDAERKRPSLKWQRLLTGEDRERQKLLMRWKGLPNRPEHRKSKKENDTEKIDLKEKKDVQ